MFVVNSVEPRGGGRERRYNRASLGRRCCGESGRRSQGGCCNTSVQPTSCGLTSPGPQRGDGVVFVQFQSVAWEQTKWIRRHRKGTMDMQARGYCGAGVGGGRCTSQYWQGVVGWFGLGVVCQAADFIYTSKSACMSSKERVPRSMAPDTAMANV